MMYDSYRSEHARHCKLNHPHEAPQPAPRHVKRQTLGLNEQVEYSATGGMVLASLRGRGARWGRSRDEAFGNLLRALQGARR